MSRERAELSKKNPYHIPRYRYYELKYFCRQYDDWKKALTLIDGWQTSPNDISGIIKGCPPESPTERIALSRVFYSSCMENDISLGQFDRWLYGALRKSDTPSRVKPKEPWPYRVVAGLNRVLEILLDSILEDFI